MNQTRGTKQSLTSMTRKKTLTDRRCGSCHVKQAFAYFKACTVWLFDLKSNTFEQLQALKLHDS